MKGEKRIMRRLGRKIKTAAAGILTAALCFGAAGSIAGENWPGARITVKLFQFQPARLEVKAGTTVTWVNEDDIGHTITSGAPDNKDGRFDMRLAGKGATFSFTFAQRGTYAYFCNRHNSMMGEIHVSQ
jgi:plastocyanin